jgi:hypothetical protein
MAEINDINWLEARGFLFIGHWSNPTRGLQHRARLSPTAGIYAFIVNKTIRYVGMTTRVRSRVRDYNRSLGPSSRRPTLKLRRIRMTCVRCRRRVALSCDDLAQTLGGNVVLWRVGVPHAVPGVRRRAGAGGATARGRYSREHACGADG